MRIHGELFVFSMVDDVAQPGIQPNAQHVFALSCGKKIEGCRCIECHRYAAELVSQAATHPNARLVAKRGARHQKRDGHDADPALRPGHSASEIVMKLAALSR